VELAVLQEHLEDRDVIVAKMAATQSEGDKQEAHPPIVSDDPTIFESHAREKTSANE
jgi:hypothetical protein